MTPLPLDCGPRWGLGQVIFCFRIYVLHARTTAIQCIATQPHHWGSKRIVSRGAVHKCLPCCTAAAPWLLQTGCQTPRPVYNAYCVPCLLWTRSTEPNSSEKRTAGPACCRSLLAHASTVHCSCLHAQRNEQGLMTLTMKLTEP